MFHFILLQLQELFRCDFGSISKQIRIDLGISSWWLVRVREQWCMMHGIVTRPKSHAQLARYDQTNPIGDELIIARQLCMHACSSILTPANREVDVAEFGKRLDTTHATDFRQRQLVTDLLWNCYGETRAMDFGHNKDEGGNSPPNGRLPQLGHRPTSGVNGSPSLLCYRVP